MTRFYEYVDKEDDELKKLFLDEFISNYRYYLKRYFGEELASDLLPNLKLSGLLKLKDHADRSLLSYRDYWEIVIFRYAVELGTGFKEAFDKVPQIKLFVDGVAYSKLGIPSDMAIMAAGYEGNKSQKAYWDWVLAFYEKHFYRDAAIEALTKWHRDGYLSLKYLEERSGTDVFADCINKAIISANPVTAVDAVDAIDNSYEAAQAVIKEIVIEMGWGVEVFGFGIDFCDIRGLLQEMGEFEVAYDYDHDHAIMYRQIASLSGHPNARDAVICHRKKILRENHLSQDEARKIMEYLNKNPEVLLSPPDMWWRKDKPKAEEGTKSEGTKSEGTKSEGTKSEGAKSEGTKSRKAVGMETLLKFIKRFPGKRTCTIKVSLGLPQSTLECWLKELREQDKIIFKGPLRFGGYYLKGDV